MINVKRLVKNKNNYILLASFILILCLTSICCCVFFIFYNKSFFGNSCLYSSPGNGFIEIQDGNKIYSNNLIIECKSGKVFFKHN